MTDLLEMEWSGLDLITSGGQCGADQGALIACHLLGFPSGGWAPAGWRTANGAMPLLSEFGLREHSSRDYAVRTKLNIEEADGVLIIASNLNSPGTKLTIQHARKLSKPVMILKFEGPDRHTTRDVLRFLAKHSIRTLLVAGNRDNWPDTKHVDAASETIQSLIMALRSGSAAA